MNAATTVAIQWEAGLTRQPAWPVNHMWYEFLPAIEWRFLFPASGGPKRRIKRAESQGFILFLGQWNKTSPCPWIL
jgi:hypothetical protein